jgi:hypothetical protein
VLTDAEDGGRRPFLRSTAGGLQARRLGQGTSRAVGCRAAARLVAGRGVFYRGRSAGVRGGRAQGRRRRRRVRHGQLPADGLPRAQMGPVRADGWAGADLGRAFGLGPDR